MMALTIWKQFPRQIASDLSEFHHRRIAEWHQGTMSSYELLELLEYMNPRGAFRSACHESGVLREMPWSEEEEALFYGINEVSFLRAITYVANGGESYDPYVFKSPQQWAQELEEAEAPEVAIEHAYSFMEGG